LDIKSLLHKLSRKQDFIGNPYLIDSSFEPGNFILPYSDGGFALANRTETDRSFKFFLTIDKCSHQEVTFKIILLIQILLEKYAIPEDVRPYCGNFGMGKKHVTSAELFGLAELYCDKQSFWQSKQLVFARLSDYNCINDLY